MTKVIQYKISDKMGIEHVEGTRSAILTVVNTEGDNGLSTTKLEENELVELLGSVRDIISNFPVDP